MNATRTLLISHGVSIALLTWLLLREPPVNPSTTNDVLAACDEIRRELDDLQSLVQALRRELPSHETIERQEHPRAEKTISLSSSSLDGLAKSIRSLEAKISTVSTHPLNLEEIQESYPTTNWAAWEAYKQRCGMSTETIKAKLAQASQRDGDVARITRIMTMTRRIEATLSKPVHLKRPQDILKLFGSPTSISVEKWGIVWRYQSPDESEWFAVQFMHGFVKNVRSSLVSLGS